MESILEFLPVILFVIYALLRNRKAGRKKAAQQAELGPADAVPSTKKNPLQEFLRQLEEAAAEASGEPLAGPTERAVLSAAAEPAAQFDASVPTARNREGEFREVAGAGFDHDRHGFGPENPLSEPVFESQSKWTPRQPPLERKAYDPHHLTETPLPLPRTTAPRRAAVLAERLRHPDAARDAIVLNAIFQRPGERSHRHR